MAGERTARRSRRRAPARLIDALLRADPERERFESLANESTDIIGFTDPAGIVRYANPAALALLEVARDDLVGKHFFEWFPPSDRPFVSTTILPAMLREGRWIGEFRFRSFRTGRALPILYNAFVLKDPSGTLSGFATISHDTTRNLRIDVGMRALADAGKVMHDSLDFDTTMQNIADAVVSGFANLCSVEIAEPDTSIRTLTLATRDPSQASTARAAADVRNAAIRSDHPIPRAIYHGESTLKRTLEPAFLASTGLHEFIGSGRGLLDLVSVIYVPIRSPHDGRIYGSLSCGLAWGDSRGFYADEDVRFAEEIAVRAGLAFDNAHAYERTRRVAVEMQAASLPTSLPNVPALKLDADYRPATDEATIGGDWYDAFMLPDGRVAITIGDVIGHGLRAAIWMTKMRQAMQVAAILDPDPRTMLGVANRTLRMLDQEVYATAMAAIYDCRSRTLVVASAGHPGPVIVHDDGTADEPTLSGLLLGLTDDVTYGVRTFELRIDDLVVFYTDGLVEAERDSARGEKRLREALKDDAIRNAVNPALAIFERVLAGLRIQDDVAIVTARVTG